MCAEQVSSIDSGKESISELVNRASQRRVAILEKADLLEKKGVPENKGFDISRDEEGQISVLIQMEYNRFMSMSPGEVHHESLEELDDIPMVRIDEGSEGVCYYFPDGKDPIKIHYNPSMESQFFRFTGSAPISEDDLVLLNAAFNDLESLIDEHL